MFKNMVRAICSCLLDDLVRKFVTFALNFCGVEM